MRTSFGFLVFVLFFIKIPPVCTQLVKHLTLSTQIWLTGWLIAREAELENKSLITGTS